MDVIHVPAPPKGAFNKHRPMSDLIKAQVNHFKHLEHKLTAEQREGIPQHRITTEGHAAAYIAVMTRFLRSGVAAQPIKQKTVTITERKPAAAIGEEGLSMAAVDASNALRKPKSKPSSKKKKK
jgi:hypothetical protein